MNDVMEMKLKSQHVFGARPEYYMGPGKGGLAIYNIELKAPWGATPIKRVYAARIRGREPLQIHTYAMEGFVLDAAAVEARKRHELLFMAEFWMQ